MVIAKPNRKKKDSSFFLARIQPMKSHGLLVYYCPPNFFFLSVKSVLLPLSRGRLARGSPWLQTVNCNSLLIPNKPIFAETISGSLFVSGQNYLPTDNTTFHKLKVQSYKTARPLPPTSTSDASYKLRLLPQLLTDWL